MENENIQGELSSRRKHCVHNSVRAYMYDYEPNLSKNACLGQVVFVIINQTLLITWLIIQTKHLPFLSHNLQLSDRDASTLILKTRGMTLVISGSPHLLEPHLFAP